VFLGRLGSGWFGRGSGAGRLWLGGFETIRGGEFGAGAMGVGVGGLEGEWPKGQWAQGMSVSEEGKEP
jgi:hypothetical protein